MKNIFKTGFAMLLSLSLLLSGLALPTVSAAIKPADVIFNLDFSDYQSYAPIKDSVSGVTLMESGLYAENVTDGKSVTRKGVRLSGDANQNGIKWTSDVLDPMRNTEGGFTLNMWVYFVDKQNNTQFFAFTRNCTNTTRNDVILQVNASNRNTFSANTCYDINQDANKCSPWANDSMVYTKGWYMLTLTQDPESKQMYVYINGQDATRETYTSVATIYDIANDDADTHVANYAIGGRAIWQDPVMNGYLSACTMYGRSLTSEEIANLYQGISYEVADYTAVNEALATIPADLSIYSADSAAAVTAAKEAVVYGLAVEDQARVDAMATAINDAVAALELNITDADITAAAAVDALIEALPAIDAVTKADAEAVYAVSAEYAELTAVAKELSAGKDKLLGLEAQLNVLNDRYGIANLVCYDDANDFNWTVRRNAKIGAQFYGDRTVTFGTLPAYLEGSDYIRAAQNSKLWNAGETLVEFDVFATTNLYVGWDLTIPVPAWLSENYQQTTDTVARSDGPVLTLFRRQVAAGEHIKLGYLGVNDDVYMVLLQNKSPEKPAEPAPAQKELTRVVKIACVGDSITYGSGASNRDVTAYPPQLGKLLGDSYEVKNFGLGGTTLLTGGNKPYINQTQYTDGLAYNPDIVLIMLGTNDSKAQNSAMIASDFRKDLIALVESYQALPSSPKVYIATSPYCINTEVGSNTINGVVLKEQVLPIQKAVVEEMGLGLVDIYDATFEQSIFPDAVHPNDEGYQLLARTFYDAISDYLPGDVAEVGGKANFTGLDAALNAADAINRDLHTAEALAALGAAVAKAEALNRDEMDYEDQAVITEITAEINAVLKTMAEAEIAAAAAAVDKLIEDLGEITSLEQKAAVEAARAAYEALTPAEKAKVTKLAALNAAEAAVVNLEKAAEAAVVEKMIDDLGEITSLEQKAAVEAARAAYEALSADVKALVKNADKLDEAENAIDDLEDQAAADAVTKLIEDLGEITSLDQEAAVVAAREAYDGLNLVQQAKVSEETVAALEAAEAAIAALKGTKGDVDESATVDVADIMKLKALIMADKWTDKELALGDLDESGKLDVGDIMAVKNIIMAS